jgi:tight adherence protein B
MNITTILLASLASLAMLAAVALGVVRSGPVWDESARRQLGRLVERFESLGLDKNRLRIGLRTWGMAIPATFFFLWLGLNMFLPGVVLAGLVYVAPRYVLEYLIQRRSRLLRSQIVEAARALANAVKAGMNLHQGLETVAQEIPDPLAAEIQRIVADYSRGRPLAEALETVRRRLDLEPFTLFASAVEVALQHGGRVNETLLRISHALLENQRVERKMEADTASGRRQVQMLALCPPVLLSAIWLIEPQMVHSVFTTPQGQAMLCVIALLVYAGAAWARRMVTLGI